MNPGKQEEIEVKPDASEEEEVQSGSPPLALVNKMPLELREMVYGFSLFVGTWHFFYKHPEASSDEAMLESTFRPFEASRYLALRKIDANGLACLKEVFQGYGLLFVNHRIYEELCEYINKRMDEDLIHTITHSAKDIDTLQSRFANFPTQRIYRFQLFITGINGFTDVDAIVDKVFDFVRTLTNLTKLQIVWSSSSYRFCYRHFPKLVVDFGQMLRTTLKTLKLYRLALTGTNPQEEIDTPWIFGKRSSGDWAVLQTWIW
ncbi:hypothetical protein FKW77_009707 [Venturia effusa]|uniref:Uncharacterized protein n=1 Tax=Venturia effusa TaxID=50376 RepID=A0A517KXE0_9PEZI|nr:hypothetical protein FKW77_009707 [Venturia effusa]